MNHVVKRLAEKSGIDIRHVEKYADEDFEEHLTAFAEAVIAHYQQTVKLTPVCSETDACMW